MRLSQTRSAIVAVGLAIVLSALGDGGARAQDSTQVDVQLFVYQPEAITVPVGTTVVWTNRDPVAHTVTDVNQMYDSGPFEESGTYSKTFDAPGVYEYYCVPHPTMLGRVEVSG